MHCTYVGKFDESHKCNKKRRMVGPAKTVAINSILNKGISGETQREREALRLMQIGTYFWFYNKKC